MGKVIHADKSGSWNIKKGERWTECGLLEEMHPNIKIKTWDKDEKPYKYRDGVTCKRCLNT